MNEPIHWIKSRQVKAFYLVALKTFERLVLISNFLGITTCGGQVPPRITPASPGLITTNGTIVDEAHARRLIVRALADKPVCYAWSIPFVK